MWINFQLVLKLSSQLPYPETSSYATDVLVGDSNGWLVKS